MKLSNYKLNQSIIFIILIARILFVVVISHGEEIRIEIGTLPLVLETTSKIFLFFSNLKF